MNKKCPNLLYWQHTKCYQNCQPYPDNIELGSEFILLLISHHHIGLFYNIYSFCGYGTHSIGTIKCDINTIICDVGTIQCDIGII
jgi:hypothetical protein